MNDGFARTRRVAVNGTRLAYFEQGSGAPLVLVHGGVSDLRIRNGQISALAQHFRVLVYSHRYARPNAEIPDGADDPQQAHVDDLAALIELRNLERAHLVVSDLRTRDGQISALTQHFRILVYCRRYARPTAEIPDGAD